ncbi:hypothetical protein [Halogeometricum borinquense]|uniref:ParB/Sulfiredoxin domain-containing protein n=1 Tax=Halogeometricum borinquense (strain ATCC 700274 / DSM 11551 / JCM 10706 / KCTC 4070 / PR3) TaxID=469382 RepID=E4NTV3_HALBP|nr:hypothetical protein [Halogeometricum borinquense]ADQ68258.1 hypothetical protein Hbor_27110 [Halogeometricum borinquense DSM 11551]
MNRRQFRQYTAWHNYCNERTYTAPADPWKLLEIDPADVEYYNGACRLNWGLGRVQGGRWDREENCTPIRETTIYSGLNQRFTHGYDWEETALYRRAKEQFENGKRVRGYESIDAYRNVRCTYLDELYRKIEREGYRSNADATHEAADDSAYEDAYAHHLEPLVVIGRSGDIYWTEGFHRFAIASLLDVEAVPVYVLCRHEQWQRIRDEIFTASSRGLPPKQRVHLDHPDVAGLA